MKARVTTGWLGFGFVALAGCGFGEGAGLLGLLGASEEDLAAIAEAQEAFDARVEALPSVRVRIVNETNTIARISLQSVAKGPELPESASSLADFALAFPGSEFSQIANDAVLVATNGSVEGSIKCGDLVSVAVWAPFDLGGLSSIDEEFGLYSGGGNVNLSGTGTSGESNFTGDTVATARFIDPAADGLNCERGTIVIRIESSSIGATSDPETGQLLTSQTPGTGTVSIE